MKKTLLPTLLLACSTSLALAAPGNDLTTNGGFELGDTSSWVSFPTANSTFNVTGDSNSGAFAAELFNPDAPAGAVIKQANLGVGTVQPGDSITISFAAKGSFANGGVAFAEFFSEIAGGGTSSNQILTGGPLPLTGDWQTFCFTTTAGSDVSGGVTLQMVAATGAAAGSVAVLFIDDVSVKVSEFAANGGFEQGDTSGWQYFPTPNSTFDATMDFNTGAFGGSLNNPDMTTGAVIKQANLGVGTINPGDPINISFAAKGDFGIGSICFAEFFSEIAGGGTSANEFLSGGPLPLSTDWQTFSFSTTAGPDVSGGVTLQFAAINGAVSGSFANVSIDDVTITSGAGSTMNYCIAAPNSTGVGAVMSSTGTPGVGAQDFAIQASGLPVGSFALFMVGTESANAPSFNGRQCISNVCRLGPIFSVPASGVVSRDLPDSVYSMFGCAPPIVGTSYFFQAVYRDSVGTGGNWTDALCVQFGQ
ncbi:Carbohydrate binding domain protein [Planctomycetes bacterium Poly30]|uniref:Carbohydrate binding domain protein n=1 Tax=Saltatorellus ferox TaxID=2528018 RepID=A0A518EVJ1_9BACT|nr:Carbohydrate binding domain protein [Planctomycetes bacterium Poly30]